MRYGVLDDLAERQRQEAEAQRQRRAEEGQRLDALRYSELQRYQVLKDLEETQRRERQQAEAERQRQTAHQEKAAADLKAQQERDTAEAARLRTVEIQDAKAAELRTEKERHAAEELDIAQRSQKIREDQIHHPGRQQADRLDLWKQTERQLAEEQRQIVQSEPDNFAKLERHEQHKERMYAAWLQPQQTLARQQEAERQQLTASPVQTLATQTARSTEETRAPAAAPSKSAQERARDERLAAFDQAYARSIQQREQENERGGGRELGHH